LNEASYCAWAVPAKRRSGMSRSRRRPGLVIGAASYHRSP
jgi:hypothetical protein